MTFQKFQATRTWSDDLADAVGSAQWSDGKATGQIYLDCLYIESAEGIEGATGEWCLTLGRKIEFGDLETLERKLYEWANSEGYFA